MNDPGYIVFGQPILGEDEIAAVSEVLRSSWVGTGPQTASFEDHFAQYVGAKHAVAVNSCTAALHLSLLAAGVKPGDEVITTPLTFAATANVILHCGATPVFVDVDRRTMNLEPNRVEDAVTQRTKAIMPVHFAGRPCDLDALHEIAERRGLIVVEDAAHCIEGAYHGRKIGSISPLTCFSFYVTKNMTTAEGGMVTTNDAELASQMKMHALHGLSRDAWRRFGDDGYRHYEVMYPGFKYNMTDIQAAIGLCQLTRLEERLERREEIWRRYDEAFSDLPCWTPAPPEAQTRHARHLYTLVLDIERLGQSRDEVMQQLHDLGVGTGVHYRAVHLHQFYRNKFGFVPDDYPEASWISDRTLSLPLSAKLRSEEVERIIFSTLSVCSSANTTAWRLAAGSP